MAPPGIIVESAFLVSDLMLHKNNRTTDFTDEHRFIPTYLWKSVPSVDSNFFEVTSAQEQ